MKSNRLLTILNTQKKTQFEKATKDVFLMHSISYTMKKPYLILFIFLFSLNSFSQNNLTEYKAVFKNNSRLLDSLILNEKYYDAYQQVNELKFDVMVLYGLYISEQICPKNLLEYKLIPNTASNEIEGSNITLIREYAKHNSDTSFNDNCTISLIISNENNVIDKIANINAFPFNLIDEDSKLYKPIVIQKNKGLLVFDREKKFSSVAIALSNKISVIINIQGMSDTDLAFEVAEQIKYDVIMNLLKHE